MLFDRGQKISQYTVLFPHKEGAYAETYRVKDDNDRTFFLKLISFAQLNASQFDSDGKIIEVEMSKLLSHRNLCNYFDSGTLTHKGQYYAFVVSEFISGETVAQKMAREETLTVYETKQITKSVLNALSFIHSLERPIIHNEVTTQNTLIDLSKTLDDSKLIDFGHARYLDMSPTKDDLININPFYFLENNLQVNVLPHPE